MHNSLAKQRELSRDIMQIIKEFVEERKCEYQGLWLQCAHVLKKNFINKYVDADALRSFLQKGRGKHRKIILIGEHDCAKTFLMEPFQKFSPTNFRILPRQASAGKESIQLRLFYWMTSDGSLCP